MTSARGETPTDSVTVDLEVRYVETDQMAVVHHANYIPWFEVARTQLCAESGLHYADIEELGYLLMVTGVHVRYRKPARYGQTVQVTCRIDRLMSRGVHFAYEVHGPDGLCASGTTEHVWVSKEDGRPCRTPEPLREPFAEWVSPREGFGDTGD